MRRTRYARATALLLAATLTLTGCGMFKANAKGYEIRDCKAALKLVMTPDGKIPSKPKECDPLTNAQYDAAVSDVTRKARIGTPTN